MTFDWERAAMRNETRKTGIDVVGDMPWGTHFCLFYDTKEDLLDITSSYCKAGLEGGEFFLWVVADPLTTEDAKESLKRTMPDFEQYQDTSSIEIVTARDWYLQGGGFDRERVAKGWLKKLSWASGRGYAGVRVTGDTAWLEKKDWKDFYEYEKSLNEAVANQRLAVLCTYPLGCCGAVEILDVVRTHQFALAKRHGSWDMIETAGHKQAKEEIKRLNEELEERVEERTRELVVASEALRDTEAELARIARVTTLGELTASIAHEVNQPLAGVVSSGHACLRWLAGKPADLEKAKDSVDRMIRDANRASDVVGRVRSLAKKAPLQKAWLNVNETILETIVLARMEVAQRGIFLATDLSDDVPRIWADRIQLQQVILNLVINAIEAMDALSDGPRHLLVTSARGASDGVLLRVCDSGPGLDGSHSDEIFDAFYTTKADGMGMGLAVCRSIIAAHGGRLWATPNEPRGAVFQFTLPAGQVDVPILAGRDTHASLPDYPSAAT
jgi:C4-dicarboxylate-specific signal transduction histidine kinase